MLFGQWSFKMVGHLSEPTTHGGKEKVAGRRSGVLGGLDVQDALVKGFLSHFIDMVRDFCLTYHCNFIDEGPVTFSVGTKRLVRATAV